MFDQSVQIGVTNMSSSQIQDKINRMGSDFAANTYHLTSKSVLFFFFLCLASEATEYLLFLPTDRNCNHFSDALCKAITVKRSGIPGWVNRAARVGDKFKGMIGDTNGQPATCSFSDMALLLTLFVAVFFS